MREYLGVYGDLRLPATALTAGVSLDSERRHPGPRGIGPVSRPAASLLFVASMATASLDAGRYHWSGPIPHKR
jgi:hypothetical protein